MKFNKIFITTFMLVVLTIGACSSEREVMSPQQPAPAPTAPDQPAPAAEPAPTPTSEPVTVLPVVENKKQSVGSEFTEVLSNIEEIVDPTNINWPRIISINGDEIVYPVSKSVAQAYYEKRKPRVRATFKWARTIKASINNIFINALRVFRGKEIEDEEFYE